MMRKQLTRGRKMKKGEGREVKVRKMRAGQGKLKKGEGG